MRHSNIEEPLSMRALYEIDLAKVKALDEASGKHYAERVDEGMVYGVFNKGELIAYALIGPAYDVIGGTSENTDYIIEVDDYFLDYIFVLEEYRNQGVAKGLFNRIVCESNGGVAALPEEDEKAFAEKLGFEELEAEVYYWGYVCSK